MFQSELEKLKLEYEIIFILLLRIIFEAILFLLRTCILDSEVVAKMAPTRVAVVEETLAEPKDFEIYKTTYENVVLVGAGTYGSVYYVRC